MNKSFLDCLPRRGRLLACLGCLLCLGCVLSLTACSVLRDAARARHPDVTLRAVRLTGIGWDSLDLAFDLAVDNPNPFPITLEAVEYDLLVEGTRFLRGRQDLPQDVAATGKSSVTLPMRLDVSDLRNTYQALAGHDSVGYGLRARLTFQIPVLGYRTLGVKRDGRVPMLWPPQVQVAGIQVQHLGLQTADLLLRLRVHNPNAVALGVDRLDFRLLVAGQPWASGALQQLAAVEAGADQLFDLPLSLRPAALGANVYSQLLQRLPLSYQVLGSLDLRTGLSVLPTIRLPLDLQGQVDVGG